MRNAEDLFECIRSLYRIFRLFDLQDNERTKSQLLILLIGESLMAEENGKSSIWTLNAAAQKEAMPMTGMLLFDMAITVVLVIAVSFIANAL